MHGGKDAEGIKREGKMEKGWREGWRRDGGRSGEGMEGVPKEKCVGVREGACSKGNTVRNC